MTLQDLFTAFARLDTAEQRLRHACEHPALLSRNNVVALQQVFDGDPMAATDGRAGRLAELDAMRQPYARRASLFPIGLGPVERMAQRVLDGELTLDTAADLLAQPDEALNLTSFYSHLVTWHAETRAQQGEMQPATTWSRLLAHACLKLCPEGPVSEVLSIAAIGWIQIAGVVLGPKPDGALLKDAHDLGEALLPRLQASADAERRGFVLHALGSLHSDPVTSHTGSGVSDLDYRLWKRAMDADVGVAVGDFKRQRFPLPQPRALLQSALDYFERALPDRMSYGRGLTLKAIAQTLIFLARIDEKPVDEARIRALCHEAIGLLPATDRCHASVVSILELLGEKVDAGSAQRPIKTVEDVLLLASDQAPAQALRTLERAGPMFEQQASEAERRTRWARMVALIPPAHDAEDLDRFRDAGKPMHEATAAAAQAEGWTAERAAATLFACALETPQSNAEDTGVALVQAAANLSPVIAAYQGPVAFALAGLSIGAAVNAVNADQPVKALRWYGQALVPFVRLPLPAMALDVLARIADIAKRPIAGVADEIVAGIGPMAFAVEDSLGAAGFEALHEVYESTFASLGDSVSSNLAGMLVQLAKGARFDALLRAGARFDWRSDIDASALMRQLQTVRQEQAAALAYTGLNELLLVSPVGSQRAVGGSDDAQRLKNLQAAFDRRVSAQSTASVQQPGIVNPEVIQHLLGRRSVLLDYFFGRHGKDDLAVYIVVYAQDSMKFFRNPLTGSKDLGIEAGDATAVLDSLAQRTLALRMRLQEDSGSEAMPDRARAQLAHDFELLLGTPTWQHLETLRGAGRDHLCIRPHGALRYYPMALLGRDGQDLARLWTVTLLPSLECLLLPSPPRHAGAGQALGLSYAGDMVAGDLPVLDYADEEVTTIAGVLGTPPVLDGEVTEERLLQALHAARWVHLCAHGDSNASAPLFQQLVLAAGPDSDGRLCAYELLHHDLRGLEVLSLGACESALGRFDAADNWRGLPAALVAAGVSTIVATLWSLRDDAARCFFVAFYQALRHGSARLDAFREAQLAVRCDFPRPRDWAVFCYLGDWDRETTVLPDGVPSHFELSPR